MTNDLPRQKLCELIGRHGPELTRQRRRCEGFLRDHCPEHRREVFALVSVLKEGVVEDLLAMPSDKLLVKRLIQRLKYQLPLDPQICDWAIETWAIAVATRPLPPPQPTKSHKFLDDAPLPLPPPIRVETPAQFRASSVVAIRGERARFAWIPPGTFLMGGNGQSDNPQHRVTISKGFWMGIFPVTQVQWQAAMGSNPSRFRGDDRPVENVSWLDAREFCQKMAHLTGKPIRLPTEAEWEYACRAGTTSKYWNGSGADSLKKVGWFDWNSDTQTKPVGKLLANPWGLYDVHGNVWEWCQDRYGSLTTDNQFDPIGLSSGQSYVIRGGSWSNPPGNCLAAYRSSSAPGYRNFYVGLRVCFHQDG